MFLKLYCKGIMKMDHEKLIAILQDDYFTCVYLPPFLYAVEFTLLPKPVPLLLSENFYPTFTMKALKILFIKYTTTVLWRLV